MTKMFKLINFVQFLDDDEIKGRRPRWKVYQIKKIILHFFFSKLTKKIQGFILKPYRKSSFPCEFRYNLLH